MKRWSVFNKNTRTTRRSFMSREAARNFKRRQAKPENYGIYDNFTLSTVR